MSIEKKESKDMKTLNKRKVTSSSNEDATPVKKHKKSNFTNDKNKKFGNKPGGKFTPNQNQKPLEKPKWNELKQKKKELKITRKKSRFESSDLFDIDVKAKKIYEELKMKKTKGNKDKLSEELHLILKKLDYGKIIMSHERSRMVQLLLKKAPHQIKLDIAEHLIPHIVPIATSKYAQFCVNRMLLYCGKDIRDKLVQGLFGHIVKLTTSNSSNSLIDLIYLKFASDDHKQFMRQEFYSDLYKSSKDKSVKTLKDTWKDSDVMKKGTIGSLKANLMKVAAKSLTDNCLVHAVLLEFLEETADEDRNDVITAYNPHLAAISSTRQGMKAARICYSNSAAKDRRAILKTMKDHIVKLCNHEHGHLLILAILNSTDDTLMMRKVLISQIVTNIKEIADNEFGKRVLLFIVSPNTKFFHPSLLQEFDSEAAIGTQKKDVEIRRKELIEGFAKDLGDSLKNEVKFWLKDGQIARLFAAILQSFSNVSHDLNEVFTAIATWICDPEWKVDNEKSEETETKMNGIEHPGIHMALKEIIHLTGFSENFLQVLEDETIKSWFGINRSCFLLVEIVKHSSDEVKNDLLKRLSTHKSDLNEQNHAGGKVLKKLMLI